VSLRITVNSNSWNETAELAWGLKWNDSVAATRVCADHADNDGVRLVEVSRSAVAEVRTDLQIDIDCRGRAKPEVRVLTVTERVHRVQLRCWSAPCRIAQEYAQPFEVVAIQMMLLPS
jgi:hypothetical protein